MKRTKKQNTPTEPIAHVCSFEPVKNGKHAWDGPRRCKHCRQHPAILLRRP